MDCSDGVREFPSSLTCVTETGYKVKNDYIVSKGFGNRKVTTKDDIIISIKLLAMENVDLSLFTYWYYNEIERGELDFKITLPIFGTLKEWTVKFIFGSMYEVDGEGNIAMELILVDDFEATEEQLCKFIEGI